MVQCLVPGIKSTVSHVKTIVRESCNSELADLQKTKEGRKRNILTACQLLLRYFNEVFCATSSLVGHEKTRK